MDIFIITDFPETCKLEIKEIINKNCEIFESVCFVKDVNKKEIVRFCYHSQSSKKICLNINNFNIKDLDKDIVKNINNIPKEVLEGVNSFAVRSEHNENIKLKSEEINAKLGDLVNKLTNLKVNLSNPNIIFYAHISKHLFFGIDLTGFDMSIRQYKIYLQPDSLNGCFSYHLLRRFNIKKGKKLLELFGGSSNFGIEFALFQYQISPFIFENKFIGNKLDFIKKEFFEVEKEELETLKEFGNKTTDTNIISYDDVLKKIMGIKKNAKLAGVEKTIEISKISLDWLDTKIEENSIDFIMTQPPKENDKNTKEIDKLYDELFYQANFILNKKGNIVILTNHNKLILENAKKNKFKVVEEIEIFRGKSKYDIILLKREGEK